MRKILLTLAATLGIIGAANAQKSISRVVDNKGTIKWVLDSNTSVIINAKNGLTKSGDTIKLGGTLTETTTIVTSATQFLQLTGLQSGSRADSVLMINNATGQVKKMSVAALVSSFANNGLSKNGDTVQLGGTLNKATTITTSATNTLALSGLASGSTNDSVLVADPTTGVIKRISLKDAVKATNGLSKNGDSVKLGGTLNQPTTITTDATKTLAIAGLTSGSTNDSVLVADPTTGVIKRISLKDAVKATNGLSKNGDSVKLGGTLNQPTTITTDATKTLAIAGLTSGSTNDSVLVADPTTGVIKRISLKDAVKATNGLSKNGDSVKLGGTLNQPTTITTDATKTLAIDGLTSGSTATDSLVVATSTGVLKRVSASTLLTSGDQIFTATLGQTSYTVTNMPANASRVWVFRNGVKLLANTDYTAAAGVLTLIPGGVAPDDWAVLAGDKIEVQWVK